ncbi:hypothetical protein BGW80DRAFT_1321953 [Lactifluus volemus]|nr:hypothetical protein BGW80DRAFT_1321953 [Lactifluus volemus]
MSGRALTLDQSPTNLAGHPSLPNVPESTSIIGSSHSYPLNTGTTNFATTSPRPTTAIVTERPADTQIISPMVNSKSRSDPLPAATATSVPISSLTLPTPSVDQQHTTASRVIPPSSALGIPLTSSPRPAPSENLPADDPPISLASPIGQAAPGPESTTLAMVPFRTPRETSASQRSVPRTRNEATFDTTTHDDPQTPDIPDSDIVQSSRHLHEIVVIPVVDTALDRLQHPANTLPSSRNADPRQ